MNAIGLLLKIIGWTWVGIVILFGLWEGFLGAFFNASGLLGQPGQYGDIYILALVALPGLVLIWLGKKLREEDTAPPEEHDS